MHHRDSAASPPRLRIGRQLRRRGDVYTLEAWLELPAELSPKSVTKLLGCELEALPSRAEILLQRPGGTRTLVAVMTEILADDGGPRLRLERRQAQSTVFRHSEAVGAFGLWVGESASSFGPLELPGGRVPAGLPWTFTPGDTLPDPSWNLLGIGSLATTVQDLRVVVPAAWHPVADAGPVEALGTVEHLDATVYGVEGRLRLRDRAGHEVTIRNDQDGIAVAEVRLMGAAKGSLGGHAIFRGAPRVVAYDLEGQAKALPMAQWRPVMDPTAPRPDWKPISPACLGHVWLALEERGALRYLEEVRVVPPDLDIGFEPDGGPRRGRVRVTGHEGAEVSLEHRGESLAAASVDPEGVVFSVETAARSPEGIELGLSWDGDRHLKFTHPCPSRGARFIGRDHRPVEVESEIAIDRLSGMRVVATSLDENERFVLAARLLAEDVEEDLELVEQIPALGQGHCELDLGILQEPLRRILSASQLPEAGIRLRVESNGGPLPPHLIQVVRFEDTLTLDTAQGLVGVGEADPSALVLEAVPLWKPGSRAANLEPVDGGFDFALERREAGPWLLLGWQGDWCRFQPTVWTVGREGSKVEEESLSKLQRVLRIANPAKRTEALATEIERLCVQVDDAGWRQIDAAIARQSQMPAATFEVLRELVHHPEAAVGAIGRMTDAEGVSRVWTVLEQWPFAWRLIPLRAWVRTMTRLHESLANRLDVGPGGEDPAAERIESFCALAGAHRPFLRVVASWLRVTVLSAADAEAELRMPSVVFEGLLENERQALLQRAAERWWPRSQGSDAWLETRPHDLPDPMRRQLQLVRAMSAFKRPVLLAPIMAAYASALQLPTRPRFLFDLRRLRAFDNRFFDLTYEYALRLALTCLIDTDPEVLR